MRSSADAVAPRRALRRLTELALLTGASLVLFVFETLIPTPLPWLRVGLANVVVVVVLVTDGFGAALAVTLLRVVLGSLFIGTFLSPTFLLSLGGGLAALIAMAAARAIGRRVLGIVGISVVGSVGHNAGQLAVLSALYLQSSGALRLLPYLILSATLVGVLTGFTAHALTTYVSLRRGGHHGTDV